MKKTQAILMIYETLIKGESFHIRYVISKCNGVSKRTALRYIKDIKDYLVITDSKLILVYDSEKDTYLLKEKEKISIFQLVQIVLRWLPVFGIGQVPYLFQTTDKCFLFLTPLFLNQHPLLHLSRLLDNPSQRQ